MRAIPKTVYQSVEELNDVIALREADAASLQPGPSRQSVLKEVAQLRAYADMKRWIASPAKATKTQ